MRLGGIVGGYLGWFGWAYVYYGIFAGFLLGAVVSVVMMAVGPRHHEDRTSRSGRC